MARVKRGVTHNKRRRKILKLVKGFKWGRKNLLRQAKTAILKSGQHAYRDRRLKKRNFRGLWHIKINAALHGLDWSYSKFIGNMLKAGITVDRKNLAHLAEHEPKIFEALVAKVR
jgi:large subunit ribosomal protein L20